MDARLGITFAKEVARMNMKPTTSLHGLITEHRTQAAAEVLRLIQQERQDAGEPPAMFDFVGE